MLSVKILKDIDKYFSTFLYFILIIILLNVKNGKSDIALGNLYPEMFKHTPKTWHHYVRMTIGRFVEWTQYSYPNIKEFKNGFLKWSKLVLLVRFRKIKVYSNFDKKRKIITRVSGQFMLHSDKPYNHYLRFNINRKLRLNITFVLIYFSVNNCTLEALRIQRDGNRRILYTFCGHHSPFNFYPNFRKVVMKVETWMKIPFALNYFFTVMDQYIVYNTPKVQFVGVLPDLIYKVNHDTIFTTYFIQVKKISNIVFSSVHNLTSTYVIYDGPGFLAHSIIVNNNIKKKISTSTFQCILQILMSSILINSSGKFQYISQYLNNNIVVDLNHPTYMNVQLPNTICLDYVCVVHINTEMDFQINVTLNEIVSEGIYNPNCKYGGIVVGEYLDYKYEESNAVCQKHNGLIEQSRSMYSKNSSLVLILYWYNIYQNITVSLSLSLTRCKSVNIDLCEYNAQCTNIINATRSLDDMNVCNLFFTKIKKRSYINFLTNSFLGSVIPFTHDDNQCSILQFSSQNIMMDLTKADFEFSQLVCHAYLVAELYSFSTHIVANKEIEFIIKGSFGKYPRITDNVQLLGQPEKLDVYSPQLYYTGNRYNRKIFSSFHIYAQINTSKYFDEFQIGISMSLPYSWVDIIVKQTAPIRSSQFETQLNLFHIATVNLNQQQYSFQNTRFRSVL